MIRTLLFIVAIMLVACSSRPSDKEQSTIIWIDENIRPLIETEHLSYKEDYPKDTVIFNYTSETDAINALLQQKTKLIIVPRGLTEAEAKSIKRSYGAPPSDQLFVHDALAIIVHPDSPDTLLSTGQIVDILKGNLTEWPKSGKKITPVFDRTGSGIISYLQRVVLKGEKPSAKLYAAGSPQKIVEHVADHSGAIGFLGYSQFSDEYEAADLRQSIRFLSLTADSLKEPASLTERYAADRIELGKYPFTFTYHIINMQSAKGSGTKFAIYLTESAGQLIALKSGMVAVHPPARNVEIKTQSVPTIE